MRTLIFILSLFSLTSCKINTCHYFELEPVYGETPKKGIHIKKVAKEISWNEQESEGIDILDIPFVYSEFDFIIHDCFYV